jgi:hypothetical protein
MHTLLVPLFNIWTRKLFNGVGANVIRSASSLLTCDKI